MVFIDRIFAEKYELRLEVLRKPRRLEVVDGRESVAGQIMYLI